jgi:hypothetical protein
MIRRLTMRKSLLLFVMLCVAGLSGFSGSVAIAAEFSFDKETAVENFDKLGYSPYAGRSYPTRVFWGDTHHHTGLSGDAFGFGNRLGIDEAFRFARGEEVVSAMVQKPRKEGKVTGKGKLLTEITLCSPRSLEQTRSR